MIACKRMEAHIDRNRRKPNLETEVLDKLLQNEKGKKKGINTCINVLRLHE